MVISKAIGERKEYVIFTLMVVFIISGAAMLSFHYPWSSETHPASSNTITTASSSSTSNYPNGQAYLKVPELYSDFGYPRIRYTDYSPYLPSKPNFTMEYQTKNLSFQVGTVQAPVIGIDQAVGLAAQKAGLDPINYSLAYAAFYPGSIVNSSLSDDPSWYLFFARTYKGFWTFGSCGSGAFSLASNVDALTGAVSESNATYCQPSSPAISGRFELKTNSSQALRIVRTNSIPQIPAALTKNGTVNFIEPRIVLFGHSSNNVAFQAPVNSSLSGEYRLCWIIQLYSPTPGVAGYQGTFAVDAENGELVSGWAQSLFPSMHIESISGSIDFSSAKNLLVSQEMFQIDGGTIGRSGSVLASVPNVVIAGPGSAGMIGFNFSSTMTKDINATLSFTNALPGAQNLSPDGLPRGVSFQFTRQAFAVPGNGSMNTRLLISVEKNAPSGTYLIELDAKLVNPQWAQPGKSEVLFFLSVWNGAGQWPPPPMIR